VDVEREFDLAALWRSSEPMMSLRDSRQSVLLQATIAAAGATRRQARVRNISRSGMMVECRFRGAAGDHVEVNVRGLGALAGSVAWTRGDRIGVMLDEPVDPEIVLRRPAGKPGELCVPRPPARAWRPALHGA
jgi:hypothetical protein